MLHARTRIRTANSVVVRFHLFRQMLPSNLRCHQMLKANCRENVVRPEKDKIMRTFTSTLCKSALEDSSRKEPIYSRDKVPWFL